MGNGARNTNQAHPLDKASLHCQAQGQAQELRGYTSEGGPGKVGLGRAVDQFFVNVIAAVFLVQKPKK